MLNPKQIKKILLVWLLIPFILAVSAFAAEKAQVTTPAGKHYIGERYGGGIVFYVDETGQNGLIAATEDQGEKIRWSNGKIGIFTNRGAVRTGAEKKGIYGGKYNTERIIAAQGAGNYAAQICANYRGGGFSDWYLPSRDELNLLRSQRKVVGGFASAMYWGSTVQYGYDSPWYYGSGFISLMFQKKVELVNTAYFKTFCSFWGLGGYGVRDTKCNVRAIRAFGLNEREDRCYDDKTPAKEGFYVGVIAPYNTIHGDFEGDSYNAPVVKNNIGYGVLIGRRYDKWAPEISYLKSTHAWNYHIPYSYYGSGDDISGEFDYHMINMDCKFFCLTDKPTQPYLLLGLCIPCLVGKNYSSNVPADARFDLGGMGVNLGCGLSYYRSPHLSITGNITQRWIGYDTIYINGGEGKELTTEIDGSGLTFNLAATFAFPKRETEPVIPKAVPEINTGVKPEVRYKIKPGAKHTEVMSEEYEQTMPEKHGSPYTGTGKGYISEEPEQNIPTKLPDSLPDIKQPAAAPPVRTASEVIVPEKQAQVTITVTTDNVNIFAGPGISYEKIATVVRGTKLVLLDDSKKWYYKVLLLDSRVGWINSSFVSR